MVPLANRQIFLNADSPPIFIAVVPVTFLPARSRHLPPHPFRPRSVRDRALQRYIRSCRTAKQSVVIPAIQRVPPRHHQTIILARLSFWGARLALHPLWHPRVARAMTQMSSVPLRSGERHRWASAQELLLRILLLVVELIERNGHSHLPQTETRAQILRPPPLVAPIDPSRPRPHLRMPLRRPLGKVRSQTSIRNSTP